MSHDAEERHHASGIAILAGARQDGSASLLRQLRLRQTSVTPLMWEHLCKLHRLTSLGR